MAKLIEKLKERSANPNRQEDTGFVNRETNSSMRLSGNGNVTIAASKNVQYKMNYSQGTSTEIAFQSNSIVNRKNIKMDEMIINGHKLNPQFYELTDMKELYGDPTLAIGNLTIDTTVLVKAWEPNLQKWVLIRRPMRAPLFFKTLPMVTSPDDMDIDDSISKELENIENIENKE